MNISKKVIFPLAFFLAFAFIAFGYASLTDELSIDGTASYSSPPKGIFITAVEAISSQNVTDAGAEPVSPTSVKSSVNVSQGGNITYKITVENNTDATYWFREIIAPELDGYDNELIEGGDLFILTKDKINDNGTTFDIDDWIPPQTTREFYAIYTFRDSVSGNISTLINFDFGGKVESYGDEILSILNNPEKYELLSEAFDDIYASYKTDTLSNIGADEELFKSLFGTELKLDGNDVTIAIQRKNIDSKSTGDSYSPSGPSGCEYTIYITTDDPTTGTPAVYAVSYTTDANGVWHQIGELYDGTVNVGTYKDSEGNTHTSINIDKWEAAERTYTVFTYKGKTVTYTVNKQYGNSYQQQKTISELMSVVDQELYNQLDKPQILVDAYKILFVEHVGSTLPEILLLREAYDDTMRFYEMRNDGQEFGLDNTATRAGILSTMEALAAAMEYYEQVHDTNH